MVIQTCSDVFAISMQLDAHALLTAETLSLMLSPAEETSLYSSNNTPDVPSNDRTTLTHQR